MPDEHRHPAGGSVYPNLPNSSYTRHHIKPFVRSTATHRNALQGQGPDTNKQLKCVGQHALIDSDSLRNQGRL